MNDDVGALQKLNVSGVIAIRRHVSAPAQRRIERLVVGDVADHSAVALHAIPKCERRMVQVLRPYHQIADLESALDQLVERDFGPNLVERHREVLIVHLAGKRLVQRHVEASGTVHVPVASAEERFEERETLDVVPVGVAEEDRSGHRIAAGSCLLDERSTKDSSSRAAVEHDQRPTTGTELYTRRVASVPHGRWSRCGDGAPRAPIPNTHVSRMPHDSHNPLLARRRTCPGAMHDPDDSSARTWKLSHTSRERGPYGSTLTPHSGGGAIRPTSHDEFSPTASPQDTASRHRPRGAANGRNPSRSSGKVSGSRSPPVRCWIAPKVAADLGLCLWQPVRDSNPCRHLENLCTPVHPVTPSSAPLPI